MPYRVDTIRLRITFPAAPASQGYNGRGWRMRPLRGWTGGARWDEEAARAEQVSAGSSLSATLDRVIAATEARAVAMQGGVQPAQAAPPERDETARRVEPDEGPLSDAEVFRPDVHGKLRLRKEIDPETLALKTSYLTGRRGFVSTEADLEALGQALDAAHSRQQGVVNGVPDVASSSPVNVRVDDSMTDANPDPIGLGQRREGNRVKGTLRHKKSSCLTRWGGNQRRVALFGL